MSITCVKLLLFLSILQGNIWACVYGGAGGVCVWGGASFMNANVAFEAWVWGGGGAITQNAFLFETFNA